MTGPDADHDERLRRARRFVWTFRAIFYPGAALLAFFMLTQRDGRADAPLTLTGVTSQNMRFTALVDSGRISQFRTVLRVQCPSGRSITQVWARVDGRPTFLWDGRRLLVHEDHPTETGTGAATLDARLSADSVLEGTMTFELISLEACRSGPISFSARP